MRWSRCFSTVLMLMPGSAVVCLFALPSACNNARSPRRTTMWSSASRTVMRFMDAEESVPGKIIGQDQTLEQRPAERERDGKRWRSMIWIMKRPDAGSARSLQQAMTGHLSASRLPWPLDPLTSVANRPRFDTPAMGSSARVGKVTPFKNGGNWGQV